jgi:ArsR family metal-binding transcriptional regulator
MKVIIEKSKNSKELSVKEQVRTILKIYTSARTNPNACIFRVLDRYYPNAKYSHVNRRLTIEDSDKIPSFDTILRARRNILYGR